jgi:hypothetical protein
MICHVYLFHANIIRWKRGRFKSGKEERVDSGKGMIFKGGKGRG